jgi:hypothetical protein
MRSTKNGSESWRGGLRFREKKEDKMRHYLMNQEIQNEDMLDLINQTKVEIGTRVAWDPQSKNLDGDITLQAIEVTEEKVIWKLV